MMERSLSDWGNDYVRELLLRGPNYVYTEHRNGRRELKMKTYAPIRSDTEPCTCKRDCPASHIGEG